MTASVERLVDSDAFRDLLHRYGGQYLSRIRGGLGVAMARELGPGDVRAVAAAIRDLTDADIPERPDRVADALDALADQAETRPAAVSDIVVVAEADRPLLREWTSKARERSPLLGALVEPLDEIHGTSDPRVGHARDALALLVDAELLLPGVDAALRPALTVYASLPPGGAA